MSDILKPSDFKGFYDISTDKHSQANVQEYIDEFEKQYLDQLLGCELADLLIADLVNGVPVAQRFTDIFDPFCLDEPHHLISHGMVKMLAGLIYLLFVRDQALTNGVTGIEITEGENSIRNRAASFSNMQARWNRGIDSYHTIQHFILDNSITYPEFEGVRKRRIDV